MPEGKRYTIAICKGAALLEETRTLLGHWRLGERAEDFAQRVKNDGLLAKATAYRANDIVHRVFIPRYLKPHDRPARVLKAILDYNLQPAVFKELVLLYSARNDPLLRDFVLQEFWPSLRRGRFFISVPSVLSFFSEAISDGKIEKPWSDQVSKKVARGLLGFLREVGFIRESSRGRRELVDYRLSDQGAFIIARILQDEGFSDSAIVEHPDWALFGLERNTLLSRLHLFGEDEGLFFQQAGNVVSFNWKVNSIEDLLITLRSNPRC
jgi:hypothetical protein